jgi:membrane protein
VFGAVGATLDRLRATRLWRAWGRYGQVRGNVLAGGIAYFAFFSLFPALAVGFTVFGLVLGGRPDLRSQVVDYVNQTFGGAVVIGTEPDQGVVQITTLTQGNVLTIAGGFGLLLLLASGVGWVGALRDGISAIFGRPAGSNPVITKLRDVGTLAGVGLGALTSVLGGLLVNGATGNVLDWVGLGPSRLAGILVGVLSSVVLLIIDTALLLLMLRLMGGKGLPFDDLFTAALAGGVGLGLLKVFGGVLLRFASHNRFLAASAVLVGLLVWMNLMARVALLCAAWAATTAHDHGHIVLPEQDQPARQPADRVAAEPVPRPRSAPAGVAPWPLVAPPGMPDYGVRAADRTSLAAGAVLGVTAAIGARVLGRSVKELAGLFGRRPEQP